MYLTSMVLTAGKRQVGRPSVELHVICMLLQSAVMFMQVNFGRFSPHQTYPFSAYHRLVEYPKNIDKNLELSRSQFDWKTQPSDSDYRKHLSLEFIVPPTTRDDYFFNDAHMPIVRNFNKIMRRNFACYSGNRVKNVNLRLVAITS